MGLCIKSGVKEITEVLVAADHNRVPFLLFVGNCVQVSFDETCLDQGLMAVVVHIQGGLLDGGQLVLGVVFGIGGLGVCYVLGELGLHEDATVVRGGRDRISRLTVLLVSGA